MSDLDLSGAPFDDDTWVANVRDRDPVPESLGVPPRECQECGAEIPQSEGLVSAKVKSYDRSRAVSPHRCAYVRFCDRECWYEWATV